jgi:undecaprenyl-diphosphatase
MSSFEAFLYGVVQGLTEYLPISSSAHLILLPRFLGTRDPGLAFDVFLHLGTLFATLIYFWREWLEIGRGVLGKPVSRAIPETVGWPLIVIATVPALAAGAALHSWAETIFRGNAVLVVTLPVGGLALFAADRLCRQDRSLSKATWRDALWIGLVQCLALVPGVSRSGSTMTGGRLLGFDRAASARFSFLISAPITAAALVFELRKWEELVSGSIGPWPLLVAAVSSFVFGLVAIGGLLRLLRRFGYFAFAVYRVGLAILIWQLLGL